MMLKLREYQKRKLQFLEDFPIECEWLNELDDFLAENHKIEDQTEKIDSIKKKLFCDSDADLGRWYVKMGGENPLDIDFFEKMHEEKYYDPTIKYLSLMNKRRNIDDKS